MFRRKYNTLLVAGTTAIRVPMIKRGVVDFAVGADWTPATGDVKVLVDNAAAANITNLPTAIAAGNGAMWEFILTAAELSCKQVEVVIADAATKAVEDQSFIVETYGNASAMYAADLSLANLPANVTQLLGTAWLTPGTAGTPDVNAKLLGGTAQTGRDLGASVLVAGLVKKNSAFSNFTFMMRDSTTHAPKTGVTVTATRRIDNGSFASCANSATEVANGWYTIDLAAADVNGRVISLRFTGTASDDTNVQIITVD